jgi:hypothetical protein
MQTKTLQIPVVTPCHETVLQLLCQRDLMLLNARWQPWQAPLNVEGNSPARLTSGSPRLCASLPYSLASDYGHEQISPYSVWPMRGVRGASADVARSQWPNFVSGWRILKPLEKRHVQRYFRIGHTSAAPFELGFVERSQQLISRVAPRNPPPLSSTTKYDLLPTLDSCSPSGHSIVRSSQTRCVLSLLPAQTTWGIFK